MKTRKTPKRTMPSATKLLAGLLTVQAVCTGSVYATDGSWTADANSFWATPGSWAGGTIGDGVGSTVSFRNDITSDRTVTISGETRTVGILNIGDSAGATANRNFTIAGTTGILAFDSGSADPAQINFYGKSNFISVPAQLFSSVNVNNTTANQQNLSGNISAGAAGTMTITNMGAGTGPIKQTGVISDGLGKVAVRQNSANTFLSLGGANTYTGGTILDSGTLGVTGGSALGTGTLVLNAGTLVNDGGATATIAGNVTLNGNMGFVATTGGTSTSTRLVLSGTIKMTGDREINVINAPNAVGGGYLSIIGPIDDGGQNFSLTKTGAGTVVIAMPTGKLNTYSGGTIIKDGIFKLATATGANTLLATGAVTVDGGTLDVATQNLAAENIGALTLKKGSIVGTIGTSVLTATSYSVEDGTISKAIGGATSVLTKTTDGTVTLSGSNSYAGATIINGGVLSVGLLANGGAASHIGKSTSAASNLVLNSGTLQYTGATASTNRNFQIGDNAEGGTGTIEASGVGALTITGTAAYGTADQSRNLVLSGSNTDDNTIAGAVNNNGTGAVAVTKNGTGKWKLSGVNNYTGGTTVNEGQLVVSGSISGNQNVAVAAGAHLDLAAVNNFTIGSGKTLTANGTVTGPTVGDLTIASGATVAGSGSITGSTRVDGLITPGEDGTIGTLATGALTLLGECKLDISSASGLADLISSTGLLTLGGSLIAGLDLDNGQGGYVDSITVLHSASGISGTFANEEVTYGTITYQIGYTSNDVILTAVPEPATWLTLSAGIGTLMLFQRARRRQA